MKRIIGKAYPVQAGFPKIESIDDIQRQIQDFMAVQEKYLASIRELDQLVFGMRHSSKEPEKQILVIGYEVSSVFGAPYGLNAYKLKDSEIIVMSKPKSREKTLSIQSPCPSQPGAAKKADTPGRSKIAG